MPQRLTSPSPEQMNSKFRLYRKPHSKGVLNEPLQKNLPVRRDFLQVFTETRLPTPFGKVYITLGDRGDYFPPKLLNLTQVLILFFTGLHFVSGLKTYFQPASRQRPTLHIDP